MILKCENEECRVVHFKPDPRADAKIPWACPACNYTGRPLK